MIEEVAEHITSYAIDSSGFNLWDLFKRMPIIICWLTIGTTEESSPLYLQKEDKRSYVADYEHLGVCACAVLSCLAYPIFIRLKIWLANNIMGSHLREFFRCQVASRKRKIT